MKKIRLLLLILASALLISSCSGSEEAEKSDLSETSSLSENGSGDIESSDVASTETSEDESEVTSEEVIDNKNGIFNAIYKGVNNFGSPSVTSEKKNTFRYVFEIDGKKVLYTVDNGEKNSDGSFTYDIQNILKRGSEYTITVENNKVVSASEIIDASADIGYTPLISGTPGEKSVLNFLKTALAPVGTTLYIYGGGWDWQDVGSAVHATTIGISSDWVNFFNTQDDSFKYSDSSDLAGGYFPYGAWNEYYYAGLDCSGYVGWAIYNILNTENGKEGYVMSASKMAKAYADNGWGKWSNAPVNNDNKLLPGDIISKSGHVYICIGSCDDGSAVILHSTPSDSISGNPGGGVQISAIGENENCEAYALACKYMAKYTDWSERYVPVLKDFSDYTDFSGNNLGYFSWYTEEDNKFLSDDENIRSMSAEEILKIIFEE